jgi:starvation-inducible DNA-binding protein
MTITPLRATRITLPETSRAHSVALLQQGLVHALDLERQAKQAHWNVRGSNFSALHALFDQVAEEAVAHADLCAERLVALGGTADGRVQTLATNTTLAPYPAAAHHGADHLDAMAEALARCGSLMRQAIDTAARHGDADTSDLCTEISRALDQRLWMVEAHREH